MHFPSDSTVICQKLNFIVKKGIVLKGIALGPA